MCDMQASNQTTHIQLVNSYLQRKELGAIPEAWFNISLVSSNILLIYYHFDQRTRGPRGFIPEPYLFKILNS